MNGKVYFLWEHVWNKSYGTKWCYMMKQFLITLLISILHEYKADTIQWTDTDLNKFTEQLSVHMYVKSNMWLDKLYLINADCTWGWCVSYVSEEHAASVITAEVRSTYCTGGYDSQMCKE